MAAMTAAEVEMNALVVPFASTTSAFPVLVRKSVPPVAFVVRVRRVYVKSDLNAVHIQVIGTTNVWPFVARSAEGTA